MGDSMLHPFRLATTPVFHVWYFISPDGMSQLWYVSFESLLNMNIQALYVLSLRRRFLGDDSRIREITNPQDKLVSTPSVRS